MFLSKESGGENSVLEIARTTGVSIDNENGTTITYYLLVLVGVLRRINTLNMRCLDRKKGMPACRWSNQPTNNAMGNDKVRSKR